jgi:hypothetical protein
LAGQLGAGLAGGVCGAGAGTGGLDGEFGPGPLRKIFSCERTGTRLKSEFTTEETREPTPGCGLDAWLTSISTLLLEHALHVPPPMVCCPQLHWR